MNPNFRLSADGLIAQRLGAVSCHFVGTRCNTTPSLHATRLNKKSESCQKYVKNLTETLFKWKQFVAQHCKVQRDKYYIQRCTSLTTLVDPLSLPTAVLRKTVQPFWMKSCRHWSDVFLPMLKTPTMLFTSLTHSDLTTAILNNTSCSSWMLSPSTQ